MYYPPIKWLGNKSQQAHAIIPKILSNLKRKHASMRAQRPLYIEPFVGSGAIIIELLKHGRKDVTYKCFDINEMIISMFNEIKYDPINLINKLKLLEKKTQKEEYYRIREEYNKNPCTDKFIYLNKTCFRGLYRVNQKTEFNASYGNYSNPIIYCENNILSLHELFNKFNVSFEVADYRDIEIPDNSTIYMDPPYYTNFNEYFTSFSHSDYIQILNSIRIQLCLRTFMKPMKTLK
jgi:DNA adenine methylase